VSDERGLPVMPEPPNGDRKSGSGWRRAGWFVAIWCGSLAAWYLFAYGLRWVMEGVGIAG
jgi:hypothetical protein